MILLVEDDDVIRTLASAMLTEHGYAVLPAKTGEEALALAEANRRRVALLLTDVVLPGISGRELRDRVRAIRSDVACLFMSGYPDDTLLRHGLEAHGTAFLPKPFAPDTLLEKVRDTLEAPGTRPSSDEGD